MASDVRLDDDRNWVTIEAGAVNVASSDLLLESVDRRGGKPGAFRRALVHDSTDGLTINFGRDYTGGVTINDARVNVRCVAQSGSPALPTKGRAGDLIATTNVKRIDGQVVGESVTLWLCIGQPVQMNPVDGAAYWVPITTGQPVKGSA